MKYGFLIIALFIGSFVFAQKINWLDVDKAQEVQKQNPEKPYLIQFYTTWCGFCRKMDANTLRDKEVAKFITDNYIPVKFNAEHKEEITFLGRKFGFIKNVGRRGVHFFAFYSTKGNLGYPSFVVMNAEGKTQSIMTGYLTSEEFMEGLKE